MKLVIAIAAVLFLAGCDQVGRYQFAPEGYNSVWRFDTKTGEISKCLFAPGATLCSDKTTK